MSCCPSSMCGGIEIVIDRKAPGKLAAGHVERVETGIVLYDYRRRCGSGDGRQLCAEVAIGNNQSRVAEMGGTRPVGDVGGAQNVRAVETHGFRLSRQAIAVDDCQSTVDGRSAGEDRFAAPVAIDDDDLRLGRRDHAESTCTE